MARQYSARTFLRNTPNALLRRYFEHRQIDLGFDWGMLWETEVNHLMGSMISLPDEIRASIDSDFTIINELASNAGTLSILEEAENQGMQLADLFAGMANAYERAMWTFLEEPELFRVAGSFHELDRRGGWRRRFVGKRLEVNTSDKAMASFEKALHMIYRRQGRGRFCHVDNYLRHDPIRHCFFAYPEDYASSEIGYDDHGRFQQRARRAAFEVIFVYRVEEGTLELCARGNRQHAEQLMEIFCIHILDLCGLPPDTGQARFDLNVLRSRNFRFPTDPQDEIDFVEVRQLRLTLPFSHHRGFGGNITVAAGSRAIADHAIYRLIDEGINKENLPFRDVQISQAKLRICFMSYNGKRPKTLTFDITYPDRCTLKDDKPDQIAKKYLKKWGICNG